MKNNKVNKILGEAARSTWPKTVNVPIHLESLGEALEVYESSDDDSVRQAIFAALNIKLLGDLLDRASLTDDDFSGDDGLICENGDDAEAIVGWMHKVVSPEDYCDAGVFGTESLVTANDSVSHAIGQWLRSIGVNFEFNAGK